MSAEHTPTPWELIKATGDHGPYITGLRGDICDFYTMSNLAAASVRNDGESIPIEFSDASANAAFVVRAVNSYTLMVEALESAQRLAEHEVEQRGRADSAYHVTAASVLNHIEVALTIARAP